jgi:hypothetical protein
MRLLPEWNGIRPLIGVVHLKPLPGSPGFAGSAAAVRDHALADADALVAGGVHGLIVENFGDAPFFPGRVPPVTVAEMTLTALDIRRRFPRVPLGVNVLRNDGLSALAVAVAVGAAFLRVNILSGARVTDQGVIQGIAHDLLRERKRLKAEGVRILADVAVKHSAPLAPYDAVEEVEDVLARGRADAVVVSGSATGKPVDVEELRRVHAAAGGAPVILGSGVTVDNLPRFASLADGFIVGTALKQDGRVDAPVDGERVRRLVAALTDRRKAG